MKIIRILKILVPPILVLGFFLYAIYRLPNTLNSSLCTDEDLAKKIELIGVIVSKYRDKNHHDNKAIGIINEEGVITQSTFLVNDRSGVYEYILPGDSIVKPSGRLDLNLYRNDSFKIFYLDYGCK